MEDTILIELKLNISHSHIILMSNKSQYELIKNILDFNINMYKQR